MQGLAPDKWGMLRPSTSRIGIGQPQQRISPPPELLNMPPGPEREKAIAYWRMTGRIQPQGNMPTQGGMPEAPMGGLDMSSLGGGGGYRSFTPQMGTEELLRGGITAPNLYGQNISARSDMNQQYGQRFRQRFNPRWGSQRGFGSPYAKFGNFNRNFR